MNKRGTRVPNDFFALRRSNCKATWGEGVAERCPQQGAKLSIPLRLVRQTGWVAFNRYRKPTQRYYRYERYKNSNAYQ